VLEQLDILEIQQTAIRQLTTEQESAAAKASVTPAPTVTPVTAEATKTKTPQSVVVSANGDDSESEVEQGEATDVTPDLPKPAEVPAPSVTDTKKAKVSSVMQLKICFLLCWVGRAVVTTNRQVVSSFPDCVIGIFP